MTKAVQKTRAGMSFVIAAAHNRNLIFEITRVAELFIQTLLHYRTLGHYKLHAYVVMPDHVQLILTPQSITIEQAVALIENGFASRLGTELPVWDEGFTAYSIASIHDLEVVRAHLHQLPVRANLAAAAELYPHSSAHRQAPTGNPVTLRALPLTSPTAKPEEAARGRHNFRPQTSVLIGSSSKENAR